MGIAIGYSVYKLGGGPAEFSHWIDKRYLMSGGDDVYYWAIGGILVGGALSSLWPKKSN